MPVTCLIPCFKFNLTLMPSPMYGPIQISKLNSRLNINQHNKRTVHSQPTAQPHIQPFPKDRANAYTQLHPHPHLSSAAGFGKQCHYKYLLLFRRMRLIIVYCITSSLILISSLIKIIYLSVSLCTLFLNITAIYLMMELYFTKDF